MIPAPVRYLVVIAATYCTTVWLTPAQPAPAQPAPAQPEQPEVTVCHTRAQTNCLWIDGRAEWH